MSKTSSKLKEAYEASGLSYSELSKLTGISRSSLQRYVVGTTKKVPAEAVHIIEKALGLNQGFVLGRNEDPPATPEEEQPALVKQILEQLSLLTEENMGKALDYFGLLIMKQERH